jgi:Protein of unknown function (DUF1761)
MSFLAVNFKAIFAAALAAFLFGGLWYGVLSKHWLDAAGLTEQDIKGTGGPSPMPFVVSFLSELVMAYVFAGLLIHVAKGNNPTIGGALISGAFVWLGFVATTLATNHAYQMQKRALTLIDGGHWLGVLLIQAVVLAYLGVKS